MKTGQPILPYNLVVTFCFYANFYNSSSEEEQQYNTMYINSIMYFYETLIKSVHNQSSVLHDFCIGNFFSTSQLLFYYRSHTDINLQDVFLFNKVSAHFEVTIEVYAKLLKSDSNTASSLVKDAENILGTEYIF